MKLRNISKGELHEVLGKHTLFLKGKDGGARADLSRTVLDGYDLSFANLTGAYMPFARMRGVRLYGADLSKANLTASNLRDSTMIRTDLRGACLNGANLSRTYAADARMAGVLLTGANLAEVDWKDCRDLVVLGQDMRGYLFVMELVSPNTGEAPIVRAGCRNLHLPEAFAHWSTRHKGMPVLRAQCLSFVAAAEMIALAKGWMSKPVVDKGLLSLGSSIGMSLYPAPDPARAEPFSITIENTGVRS